MPFLVRFLNKKLKNLTYAISSNMPLQQEPSLNVDAIGGQGYAGRVQAKTIFKCNVFLPMICLRY